MEWLATRIGPTGHPLAPSVAPPPDIPPRTLPDLNADISTDPIDRLAHARGQGLVDVIRLRAGLIPALPDVVCRPADDREVESILAACARAELLVIPWGGGTSVTGGVNVVADDRPVLSMDLERLSGLADLDEVSGLATFGSGTTGPAVERALAPHELTLGHFPQSWELSTVGGWVVTRSSGQESLGYGRIEDMVAGLELVAPVGRILLDARPASAAGPDLRQLVMGSEGRFGVVTEVTLRVRTPARGFVVEGAFFPELEAGVAANRALLLDGVPLTMVRLSDPAETQVALAVGLARSPAGSLVRRYLRLRGISSEGCLMLYGAAGDRSELRDALGSARSLILAHRGVTVGRRPGRHWKRDRFLHPYLRESLLDLGYATDTLETANRWSELTTTRGAVIEAIQGALAGDNERVAVLCHLSHPYRDGASLYFTFFFRCAADPEHTIHRWATIKRAAGAALVRQRATISHHHGVGQWHAPWLEDELGGHGKDLLETVARRLDPAATLNPQVLLDPSDRLEA